MFILIWVYTVKPLYSAQRSDKNMVRTGLAYVWNIQKRKPAIGMKAGFV